MSAAPMICECSYQPGDSGHEFGCPARHSGDMECTCEDCLVEDDWLRTCDNCGAGDATVAQGYINAFYSCQACSNKWL